MKFKWMSSTLFLFPLSTFLLWIVDNSWWQWKVPVWVLERPDYIAESMNEYVGVGVLCKFWWHNAGEKRWLRTWWKFEGLCFFAFDWVNLNIISLTISSVQS